MKSDTRVAILCVDDDPRLLDGLSRALRQDFAVTTALSGAAGLEALLSSGPFAVVVADIRMPGMDGATFLRLARQAPCHPQMDEQAKPSVSISRMRGLAIEVDDDVFSVALHSFDARSRNAALELLGGNVQQTARRRGPPGCTGHAHLGCCDPPSNDSGAQRPNDGFYFGKFGHENASQGFKIRPLEVP